MPPMFSVIVTDYAPSIPRALLRRKMASLAAQSCQDFEVLVYHDGPKTTSYAEDLEGMELPFPVVYHQSAARENDWGHSNRDRGIRAALGEWIIHTNADNVFYPDLIQRLKSAAGDGGPCFSQRPRLPFGIKSIARRLDLLLGTDLRGSATRQVSEPDIMIYAVRMQGMLAAGDWYIRRPEMAEQVSLIWGGVPAKQGAIDAMQLVMRRKLWLAEGGWSNKRHDSDGILYARFAKKYAVRAVPDILGEHW